jgi:hypothetical protein
MERQIDRQTGHVEQEKNDRQEGIKHGIRHIEKIRWKDRLIDRQVMWNRRRMIGKRASSMESDIEKEADGRQIDRQTGDVEQEKNDRQEGIKHGIRHIDKK